MNRFIYVNGQRINVSHITKIIMHDEEYVTICLDTGETLRTEDSPELRSAILGSDHAVAIVPCDNISATMYDGFNQFLLPVKHLVVYADGDIRPLELSFDNQYQEDGYSYMGLTKDT